MKKTNGVAQLSDPTEEMRMQVIELELRARYWKAQHDIRYYTLEAEKIQEPYNTWLEEQKVKNEKAQADFLEQMEKMKEQGADIQVDGQSLDIPEETSEFTERVTEIIKEESTSVHSDGFQGGT